MTPKGMILYIFIWNFHSLLPTTPAVNWLLRGHNYRYSMIPGTCIFPGMSRMQAPMHHHIFTTCAGCLVKNLRHTIKLGLPQKGLNRGLGNASF